MLIRGGVVVDVVGERPADVRTSDDGHISEVGPELVPLPGEQVHNATGKLVIPGGIDAHTHLHMPVGAVRVGRFCERYTCRGYRRHDDPHRLRDRNPRRGPHGDGSDLALVGRARRHRLGTSSHLHGGCARVRRRRGRRGWDHVVQVYLAYPDRLQVDDATIVRLMHAANRQGALVTLHCENGGAIEELRREALAAGRTGVIEHAWTRLAVLEGEAVGRAAALAEITGASIYIVHVSSAQALAAVRAGQERGVDIKAETCPQYLYLDVSRLEGPDAIDFGVDPTSSRPLARRRAVGGYGGRVHPYRRNRSLPLLAGRSTWWCRGAPWWCDRFHGHTRRASRD